ncbi:MAG TPA: F0F1 ATP synthase subunit A [Fimbriimonadaceae bacterium]|nr:F0F1 ATP synthase subunit A [Fimbriimonadaceae bacterium]
MNLLPTLLPVLAEASSNKEGIGLNIFWYTGLVMLTVSVFYTIARRGLTKRTPVGLPAKLAEHVYLFLENMTVSVIGPHGRKYVSILLAFWSFIFVANIFGLIFPYTPSSDWSLNIGMALITVGYVQWEGIRVNGLWGHIKHFSGPKMAGAMVLISGLLFCVEIVSECMKLVSLSIRLYGNIEGGHIVITALNGIVGHVPLGGLLLPIKLFTCVIQAFVWTILFCTYLNIVTSHEHEEEHYDVESMHQEGAHLVPAHNQTPDTARA